jgi:beta-glucosidase
VYYNHFNTGRPAKDENDLNYVSAYIDLPNSPKFPFGFGLSYTTFQYGEIQLSRSSMNAGQKLTAGIPVTNKGNFDGEETLQLYIRDMVGSVVRPVKELKAFQKIFLRKGETRTVTFSVGKEDLRFYNNELNYVFEPGEFKIFIGSNSRDVKEATFQLTK